MGRRFDRFQLDAVSEEEYGQAVYLNYWVTFHLKSLKYLTFGVVNFFLDKKRAANVKPSGYPPNDYYFVGLDENDRYINAYVPEVDTGNMFETVIKCLKAIWKQKGWPIEDLNKIVEQKDSDVTFTLTKMGSIKVGVEYGPDQTRILLFTRKLGKQPLELMKVRTMLDFGYRYLFHDIELTEGHVLIYSITRDIIHKVDIASRELTVDILTHERPEQLLRGFIDSYHPDMTREECKKAQLAYMNS